MKTEARVVFDDGSVGHAWVGQGPEAGYWYYDFEFAFGFDDFDQMVIEDGQEPNAAELADWIEGYYAQIMKRREL